MTDKSTGAPPYLSVVVPAYNEEARIAASLRRMAEYFGAQTYRCEILVVDDGSTDSTRDIVREFSDTHPTVRLLTYPNNRGKGHAVRHGVLQACGELVLFSDADLATPIEEVDALRTRLSEGFDVAIASRDIEGSRLERRQSAVRELGGKLFNRCVRLLAVPGIHDTQCGFKLFTRAAVQAIFPSCRIDNFSFDVEVLYLARLMGLRIVEVPVAWRHQEGSKVRFVRDAFRMLKTLVRIRVTDYGAKPVGARGPLGP